MTRSPERCHGGPEAGRPPCAPAMASPLLAGLSEAGLLEPTLAAWLADEEVQTVTDLIHCFRTEADALRSAPIAHAAWRRANSAGPARWERTAADRRLAVRDLSMNERLGDPVAEARRRAPKRARAVRPRAKGKPGPQKEKDRRDRLAAAAEAVRRSASWGPGTGIAQGIPRGVHAPYREVRDQRHPRGAPCPRRLGPVPRGALEVALPGRAKRSHGRV